MKPVITHEQLRALLDYSPEAGSFLWKVDRRMGRTGKGFLISKAGDVAGGVCKDRGYRQIVVMARHYLEHRLAFFWMTGGWPTGEIDHINGDRQDNRWGNLRDVPQAINKQNLRRARSDSRTGVQGVQFNKRKQQYVARVTTNGKCKSLAYFATSGQAHQAYVRNKRADHAGCTI